MSWLGIDIGTSSVKTVICDDDDNIIAEAEAPLTVSRLQPGWSEQDPRDWWHATCQTIHQLPLEHRQSIAGVGLSGQMHGAVLLDGRGEPLRPAILWNDGRAAAQCGLIDPHAQRITGNLAMPGFTAPKLLWVQSHEPDIFAQIDRVLLPKDYLRYRLTGEMVSDMSDASGTLWLDMAKRRWSDEMLAACDLAESHMPSLIEGSAVSGTLCSDVATELGLAVVPVAGGAGDQAAGAIGAGAVNPGDAFLSLGTSGVIFAATEDYAPAPEKALHSFCHALPGKWHQMSVMLSAAACLEWARQMLHFDSVAEAIAAVEGQAIRDDAPLFLPYLSGERTPHNDAEARGVFYGLSHDHDRAIVFNAVLEGVAFGLRDGLDAMTIAVDELSVIGGGSRSMHWMQMLADILQLPLVVRDGARAGPAIGAARLARLAVYGEAVEDVCTPLPMLSRIEPEIADNRRLALFRRLYAALQPVWSEG